MDKSGYAGYSLSGRERSRWPPLTRMLMSGEMSDEKPRELYLKEKFDRWMVNEGYRRLYVVPLLFSVAILTIPASSLLSPSYI
jgi:hypothetical protein